MKRFFMFRSGFLFFAILLAFSTISCSRKSGCPAEDAQAVKTDKDGNLKVGKTKSGLLPPKASKKKK